MGDVRALPWVTDCNKPLEEQPQEALMKELIGLLQLATDGKLQGFAFACVWHDGRVSEGWFEGGKMHRLVAATQYLQYRMNQYAVDTLNVPTEEVEPEPA